MVADMNRRNVLLLATWPALGLIACGKRKPVVAALPTGASVLALGDSLTAGYGAGAGEDWPARLAGLTGWNVSNEGVNGDTTAGALARLGKLLAADHYDAILIGIGGNDMLRGGAAQATIDNLSELVRQAKAHTTYVAVIATPAPDALRAATRSLSDAAFYEKVAANEKVLLVPGVYARVLSDASLRSDQIHANAKGYDAVARQLADQFKAAGWLGG